MRALLTPLILLVVVGCTLQSVAETPRQRLFAAYADYIVYGEIVARTVEDPLTDPRLKADLKTANRRVYAALKVARLADIDGRLDDAVVLVAEQSLRELRAQLIAEGITQ